MFHYRKSISDTKTIMVRLSPWPVLRKPGWCLCGTAIRIPACDRCTTFWENSNPPPGKKQNKTKSLPAITLPDGSIIHLLILISGDKPWKPLRVFTVCRVQRIPGNVYIKAVLQFPGNHLCQAVPVIRQSGITSLCQPLIQFMFQRQINNIIIGPCHSRFLSTYFQARG